MDDTYKILKEEFSNSKTINHSFKSLGIDTTQPPCHINIKNSILNNNIKIDENELEDILDLVFV